MCLREGGRKAQERGERRKHKQSTTLCLKTLSRNPRKSACSPSEAKPSRPRDQLLLLKPPQQGLCDSFDVRRWLTRNALRIVCGMLRRRQSLWECADLARLQFHRSLPNITTASARTAKEREREREWVFMQMHATGCEHLACDHVSKHKMPTNGIKPPRFQQHSHAEQDFAYMAAPRRDPPLPPTPWYPPLPPVVWWWCLF